MRKRSLRVSDDIILSKPSLGREGSNKSSLRPIASIKKYIKKFKNKHNKVELKRRVKAWCSNSSIHGYSYLVDQTLHTWERWVWLMVHVLATSFAGYVVYAIIQMALGAPTVTSSSPIGVPLNTIPHPGVAICSLNKMDRLKMEAFADEMLVLHLSYPRLVYYDNFRSGVKVARRHKILDLAKGQTKYSKEEVKNLLWYLGLTYDYEVPPSNEYQTLQKLIQPYSLQDVIKRLTMSCEDLIVRCVFHGELMNCSDIFILRRTSEGYCCTFNYRRENDYFISNASQELPYLGHLTATPSQERGLSLVLDPKLDRYMFTKLPNLGFKILLFNAEDYADVDSGSCTERFLPPCTETFMNINAINVQATPALERLAITARKCLASHEKTEYYKTFGDCMMTCRRRTIRKLCGCTPFNLPPVNETEICTLNDYDCLFRWKEKWLDAWTMTTEPLETGDAEDGTLPCGYCHPDCSDNRFRVQENDIHLQADSLNAKSDDEKIKLKQTVHFVNHSVLHIFFSKDIVLSLRHDVLYSWFDWISSLGGICGLVIGCSIISIFEIIYFLVFGGPPLFKRNLQSHKERQRRIYWQELGVKL